ncbi:hypothetical protein Lal_00042621 [Lupinus albus]|nr:hypothetical protein Lal_00031914 [Lupinus albus]KAF1892730.1 hypothetical protein Lal_00042621 [Lupinus albus]
MNSSRWRQLQFLIAPRRNRSFSTPAAATESCNRSNPLSLFLWRLHAKELQCGHSVDITDNELAYLESIHLFVEILDHFFSNVCELDLVFNFHKVYLILDEFILAGELQETSKMASIERMGELEKLE